MKITLRRADPDRRDQITATVDDDNFVVAARDAAWTYCLYTGGGAVTAYEPSGARIVTVRYEIHDE